METFVLWNELGRRMEGLTPADTVVTAACEANPWFTPASVCRAAQTLAQELLQPDRLAAWLACYPELPAAAPRRVAIVMAGNIPLVGFFDLLCVLAAGHRACVKPAVKDRVLTEWVVEALREIDPTTPAELVGDREAAEADALIATGGQAAQHHFRTLGGDRPSLLRGSRQSVAVLSGRESAAERAALADDLFAYAGLGCRNVSLIFAPQGYEVAVEVPPMPQPYRNNWRQQRALLTLTGRPFTDLGGALLVEQQEFPAALSTVAVARYEHLTEVEAWIAAREQEIQCVAAAPAVKLAAPRRVALGQTQAPGLTDYADDVDTMRFLAEIGKK